MKKVAASVSPNIPSLVSKVMELCRATSPETEEIADAFTVSNFTVTRTLNAGTATATDVANVLATFLNDMKNRGTKRVV